MAVVVIIKIMAMILNDTKYSDSDNYDNNNENKKNSLGDDNTTKI